METHLTFRTQRFAFWLVGIYGSSRKDTTRIMIWHQPKQCTVIKEILQNYHTQMLHVLHGIFTYMSPYFMVNVGIINIPCMVHVGYICSLWSPKIMSWALYHPAFKEVAIGHGNGFLLGFHWYVRLPVVVISESAWGIQVVACLRMFCMRLYFCVHLLPCFFGWYRGKE